jgi:putative intracellular protease/amidase
VNPIVHTFVRTPLVLFEMGGPCCGIRIGTFVAFDGNFVDGKVVVVDDDWGVLVIGATTGNNDGVVTDGKGVITVTGNGDDDIVTNGEGDVSTTGNGWGWSRYQYGRCSHWGRC